MGGGAERKLQKKQEGRKRKRRECQQKATSKQERKPITNVFRQRETKLKIHCKITKEGSVSKRPNGYLRGKWVPLPIYLGGSY